MAEGGDGSAAGPRLLPDGPRVPQVRPVLRIRFEKDRIWILPLKKPDPDPTFKRNRFHFKKKAIFSNIL